MVFTEKKMHYDFLTLFWYQIILFLKWYKISILTLQSAIMTNMSYFCELCVGYIWEILMRLHHDLKGKFIFIHWGKALLTFPHPISWTSRKGMKRSTFYFNKWLQGLLSPPEQQCGKKPSPLLPQKQNGTLLLLLLLSPMLPLLSSLLCWALTVWVAPPLNHPTARHARGSSPSEALCWCRQKPLLLSDKLWLQRANWGGVTRRKYVF